METIRTRGSKLLAAATAAVLGCAMLAPSPAQAAEVSMPDPVAAVTAAERALGLDDDTVSDRPQVLVHGAPVPILEGSAGLEITPGAASGDSADHIEYTSDQLSANAVRFAAVISDHDAVPASWDFGDDADLIPLSDGRVSVSDLEGNLIASVDAPWAVDAGGTSLETSYRVEGSTLIQDVQTDSGTAFPVVADPKYSTFPGYWTVTFNRAESATVVGTVAGCAALFAKSPVPVLRALTVTCGVLAAFSTAQLAGGKCVKLHLAGVPGVLAQWWPTFPKC